MSDPSTGSSFDRAAISYTISPGKPPRPSFGRRHAERWIGWLRRELLDRTIIWNRHQLEQLVTDYIDHYSVHHPRP